MQSGIVACTGCMQLDCIHEDHAVQTKHLFPPSKSIFSRRTHAVKLVTASLSGVLRVHLPRARDYRVEDCLLEVQLEAGILQIEAGYFTGCVLSVSGIASCWDVAISFFGIVIIGSACSPPSFCLRTARLTGSQVSSSGSSTDTTP